MFRRSPATRKCECWGLISPSSTLQSIVVGSFAGPIYLCIASRQQYSAPTSELHFERPIVHCHFCPSEETDRPSSSRFAERPSDRETSVKAQALVALSCYSRAGSRRETLTGVSERPRKEQYYHSSTCHSPTPFAAHRVWVSFTPPATDNVQNV